MASFTSSGERRHQVQLQNPSGAPVSDGDGEYAQDYETFATVNAAIMPASAENLERKAQNTLVASASHLIVLPYIEGVGTETGVTTRTRVRYGSRIFFVRGYSNPEERNIEIVLVCQEEVK